MKGEGLLAWLIVGHAVGDFLLQTGWMANNKAIRMDALVIHVSVYTACVSLFSMAAGGLSFYGGILIFVAHLILDRRYLVTWWVRNISQATRLPWMTVAVDQSWHLLVLALATLLK